MPDDNKQGSLHSTTDGGVVGHHLEPEAAQFPVGPATASEFNTVRLRLLPVACFRIDDVRFKLDSSFPLPGIKEEMDCFSRLRKENPKLIGAPISVFGHADPTFQGNFELGTPTAQSGDEYNKTLSGRRAIAIYALLVRDPSFWETLYTNHLGGDVWGEDSIRTMLNFTDGKASTAGSSSQTPADSIQILSPPPSGSASPSPAGSPDSRSERIAASSGERQQLFLKYMNVLCGDLKLDKSADFLAKGAGPNLKGDVQGCSRFNPLVLFSQEKEDRYKRASQSKDRPTLAQRDAANSSNRRVMILIFRRGSQVLPAKWPCPSYKDGPAGCKKRFFSDGDTRRSTHAPGADSRFNETYDTFACRFYQRISQGGPCNDVVQFWNVRLLAEGTGRLSERKPLANEPFVLSGGGSSLPELRGVTDASGILRVLVTTPVCTMMLRIAGVSVTLSGGMLVSLQDGEEGAASRLYSLGYGTPDIENWSDDVYAANLTQFQKDQGLQQTGTLDDQTATQLRELYGS